MIKKARQSLAALFSLAVLGQIDLRFADESAFNLTSNVPYGWIRIGEQYGIPASKGGKLNVFGLLSYAGDLTSYTTTKRVDSQQIIDWLNDFAERIEMKTVVVLDNAPWHTSAAVEGKIDKWKEAGLELFFLPPYCPHLNIVETLWRKIKHEWLRPQDFNCPEKLHERIIEILTNYGSPLFNIDFDTCKMLK